MTEGHGIIDLDERGKEPADPAEGSRDRGRSWAGRKRIPYLITAFALGVLVGGVSIAELRDSREQRARAETVELVALPASNIHSGGSDAAGNPQLNTQLVLVNAGPAPITVRVLGARRPGVLVTGTGQTLLLRSGGTGWIDVQVTLDCATAFVPEPLPVRFLVETVDDQLRPASYPIALRGSPWERMTEPVCERRF